MQLRLKPLPGEFLQFSAAVEAGWQIAGEAALQAGAGCIEPLHLLYGLCSLEKLLGGSGDSAPLPCSNSVSEDELRTLGGVFTAADTTAKDLRHALLPAPPRDSQRQPSERRSISRSSTVKAAFDRAAESVASTGSSEVTVAALLAALLQPPEIIDSLPDPGVRDVLARVRSQMWPPDGLSNQTLDRMRDSGPDTHQLVVSEILDAGSRVISFAGAAPDARLTVLCELAWEIGTSRIDGMLERILEQVIKMVPGAQRGAILVLDEAIDELLLKAHYPAATPTLSMTSMRRAMDDKRGFVWQREQDLSFSQREAELETGLYVPLVANGRAIGVIALDSSAQGHRFRSEDLYFVVAAAHQVALAIANRELQAHLARKNDVLQRLLTNFSPQVRTRLVQRAERGKLLLGGERSSVTILCSDIRGFTRLASDMEPEDVVAMLNEYFSALVPPIFAADGTVDKFIGDAVLAVFGSPEPDRQHSLKAVKTALSMQRAVRRVTAVRQDRGEPTCEMAVGIHTGVVLHGFVGSPERMEFTVIGDPVNRAARYCDGAAGGEILISADVHQRVWREVDAIQKTIPTKHEGDLLAYRLTGLKIAE